MTIGKLTRKIFKDKFYKIAKYYRKIFVDLDKVVCSIPNINSYKNVLDIGGGDGEIINHFFKYNSETKVTLIDISDNAGMAIEPVYLKDVKILKSTGIKNIQPITEKYDLIMINFVLHHIPENERSVFFNDLKYFIKYSTKVIITEVQKGHFISLLGFLCDYLISGDKNTKLINKEQVKNYLNQYFGNPNIEETNLYNANSPNYQIYMKIE